MLGNEGISVKGVMRGPKKEFNPAKLVVRAIDDFKARMTGDALRPYGFYKSPDDPETIQGFTAFALGPEIKAVLDVQPMELNKVDELIGSNLKLEFTQTKDLPPQLQNISLELRQIFRDNPKNLQTATQVAETYLHTLVRQRLLQQATSNLGPDDEYSATQLDYLNESNEANRKLARIMLEGIQYDNWAYYNIKPQQVRNFMSTFRLAVASVNKELGLKPDPKHETLGLNRLICDKYGLDAVSLFDVDYEPHEGYLPYILGGMTINRRRKEEDRISKEEVMYSPYKKTGTAHVEMRIAQEQVSAPKASLEY